jgi:pilus assembly protein Flp/PilA
MKALTKLTWSLRIWKDSRGQDLVEYALLAALLAVGTAAVLGSVADNITPVVSKIVNVVGSAAGWGTSLPSGTS